MSRWLTEEQIRAHQQRYGRAALAAESKTTRADAPVPQSGKRRKRAQPEHEQQAALFMWARAMMETYPDLELLYAVPNGGARHPAVAARLKAEGVRPGVPDINLDVPRGQYHGLRIEMKAGGNKQTPEQVAFAKRLQDQGYAFAVCYSEREAIATILNYLAGCMN